MDSRVSEETVAHGREVRWRARFERLARRHHAGVYSYLCWISRSHTLAEDLTQETFLKVWQHPPEARGEHAVRAWIYKIARNEYLQYRRRAGLTTVALEDSAADAIMDPAPAPQAILEQESFCRTVQDAVEALPELYREVIVLHNLEGLPLQQVATVLEVPLGTVKSRRNRAFEILRTLLPREEVA